MAKYKFYLAFENSETNDYGNFNILILVTEKYFQAIEGNFNNLVKI
jgi:hypothetical protein